MKVMQGVRVLEVAQFIFVPSAGAILAEWGADVVKVEHPVRGDAQRGLARAGGIALDPDRNPVIEQANRGKRSIGIDVSTPDGQRLVHRLAQQSDVFLTNYLPSVRRKLNIDLADIRAANPDIIYVRGSAHGEEGPERDVGGFDATAFWTRSGIGHSTTPPEFEMPLMQGIGGFGDSIGGMNLVAGIAAALFHRGRTGAALEIDVSLLSTAWWASGVGVNTASLAGKVMRARTPREGSAPFAPLLGNFRTADGGTVALFTMQPGPHAASLFACLGRPELAHDPRFATAEALIDNWEAVGAILVEAFAARTLADWRSTLRGYTGQWAPAQSFLDFIEDGQALANGMLIDVEAVDGGAPMKVASGPVRFDRRPATTVRAPQPAEHTEAVLTELGIGWDEIARLKAAGAVA